jgi:hypothetical protein
VYSRYIIERVRHTPMTYILGAKCKDGVVLIADRKIIYPDGRVEYEDKLSRYYYPIVLGGAGSTPMLNNFADDVLRETQDIAGTSSVSGAVFFNPSPSTTTEYPYFVDYGKYMKRVEETVRTLDCRYRDSLGDMRFDALVATQTVDRGALLHYVYGERVSEPIPNYRVLGSGEPYGTIFLNRFYKKEKTMEEIVGLGHFIIKYIERFELNAGVGGEPQIWFIPDTGNLNTASDYQYKKFSEHTEEKIAKHDMDISRLSF